MKKVFISSIIMIMIGTTISSALPEILYVFNNKYGTSDTVLDSCNTCHIPNIPQKSLCGEVCHIPNKPQIEGDTLNPYGLDLKNNLNIGIIGALAKIENIDSDKDKYNNIDEINNLTLPGEKKDFSTGEAEKKIKNKNKLVDITNYSEINNYSPP